MVKSLLFGFIKFKSYFGVVFPHVAVSRSSEERSVSSTSTARPGRHPKICLAVTASSEVSETHGACRKVLCIPLLVVCSNSIKQGMISFALSRSIPGASDGGGPATAG